MSVRCVLLVYPCFPVHTLSQFLRSAPSPPYLPLRYHSIHRRCRGSSMSASSSKGGGGGSPANSSSSIYPASFIKRNLVPGADSYRQTLAALRDMDKVRCARGLGGRGGRVGFFFGQKEGVHAAEGKGGVMGPTTERRLLRCLPRTMQRGVRSLILGSDERLRFQPGVGLSFLANWCRPRRQLLLLKSRALSSLPSPNHRSALSPPPPFNQDAVAQRAEYWRMEDALVEKAAKLLTSKV